MSLLFLALAAGCVAPPARDQDRDAAIKGSTELLYPGTRGPLDEARRFPDEPPPPEPDTDVQRLAATDSLERIQATHRLRSRGHEGVLAVARHLAEAETTVPERVECLRYIAKSELTGMEAEQESELRRLVADCLADAEPRVRIEAARVLQIHGPGAERTRLLLAIADPETRVRWAVVRRFRSFPAEVEKSQLLLLITFLQAGTREEFQRLDTDNDGALSAAEMPRGPDQLRRLDTDGDGKVSAEEWANPFDSGVRNDVCALLTSIHQFRTPDQRHIVYNPWLPAGEQQEAAGQWQAWAAALPDNR